MMTMETKPEVRTGRAQRRASTTRRRLLDAALAMFSENGADMSTIEEITERADVGKGTFYRHFANKHAVLASLAEEAVDHLVARLRAGVGQRKGLEQMLEHLLDAHLAFFRHDLEEFILLFQGRLMLNLQRETAVELEEPYLFYLQEIEAQLVPLVPQGIEPAKVRRLACAIAGFVSGFFSFAMVGMTTQEIESSVEPLRRTFVAGLSSFLTR
jgi:AcrR family transcriptional regulator